MNEHLRHQLLLHNLSRLPKMNRLMLTIMASWYAVPMLWNSNRPFRLREYLYLRYMLRGFLVAQQLDAHQWDQQRRLIDAYHTAEANLARLRSECNAKVAIFKNQPLKETFHA